MIYCIETPITQEDIEDFLRSRTLQPIGYANLCQESFFHIAKEDIYDERG